MLAQLAHGAVNADLYRARFALQQLSYGVIAQSLEAAEHQHFALIVGQTLQRQGQTTPVLGRFGRIAGHYRGRVSVVPFDLAAALPQEVHASMARDVVHPRQKTAAWTVGSAIFEDANENVLHEILTARAIAGGAQVKIQQRRVMAVEQWSQRLHIAVAYARHQGVIGNR